MTAEQHNHGQYRTPAELREFENKMSTKINATYARMALDNIPINVEPSSSPKPIDEEHEKHLAAARQRIGHLTGPIAVRESYES